MSGLVRATRSSGTRIVRSGHDEWDEQLGNEISEPDAGWLRKPHFAHGDQAIDARQQHAEGQKVFASVCRWARENPMATPVASEA